MKTLLKRHKNRKVQKKLEYIPLFSNYYMNKIRATTSFVARSGPWGVYRQILEQIIHNYAESYNIGMFYFVKDKELIYSHHQKNSLYNFHHIRGKRDPS